VPDHRTCLTITHSRRPDQCRRLIERVQCRHVSAREREVENLGLLFDALAVRGLVEREQIVLQATAEQNLSSDR
jgi:hypothetical protein